MLFGEWLEENAKDLNNPNFIAELKQEQEKDATNLELIIMLSGHMKLSQWWMDYKKETEGLLK